MLVVIFLICFVFSSYGDVVDSLLSKAITIKGLIDSNDRTHSPTRSTGKERIARASQRHVLAKTSRATQHKPVQKVPLLKRNVVFPREILKTLNISPDGQRIACLFEGDSGRYIKIIPIVNSNIIAQTIKESTPIQNFAFVGNDVVYTYYDEDGFVKIGVVNSRFQKRHLDFADGIKSLRLFKNNRFCLAECFDGEKYVLYKIIPAKMNCSELKELSGPIMSVFDRNLNPALIIREEDGLQNVYVQPQQSKKVVSELEDDLEEDESRDSEALLLLDQIEDPSSSKYISVDSAKNCYKISFVRPRTLQLEKINPKDGSKEIIYKLQGVSSLSQCRINLDANGEPLFVTASSRRYRHYACGKDELKRKEIKIHLNQLSKNFDSWYRISTTADDMIWLVCVVNDRMPDKFYLYDTRTRNLKLIPKLNVMPKNQYLRPTECHFIKLQNNEHLQVFLTRGVNNDINSPMVLLTNSSGQYKWEYMPVVQILANRGYNVMCLNCRQEEERDPDDSDDFVPKVAADIASAVNWSLKEKIAKRGNIVLLAKKHSTVHAMRMFLKEQNVFAGYIALSPSADDIAQIENLDLGQTIQPMLFIGRFGSMENALEEKVSNGSVISSKGPVGQKLSTGIIDAFLAKRFRNANTEPLSKKEISAVDVVVDGLSLIEESESTDRDDEDEEENLGDRYNSL